MHQYRERLWRPVIGKGLDAYQEGQRHLQGMNQGTVWSGVWDGCSACMSMRGRGILGGSGGEILRRSLSCGRSLQVLEGVMVRPGWCRSGCEVFQGGRCQNLGGLD